MDFCGSITAVEPDPLVLFCDRDERSPSWPLGIDRVIPNDVVARLAVAVRNDEGLWADVTITTATYKCNKAGYSWCHLS